MEPLRVSAIKEPAGASHPPAPAESLPTHEFSMLMIAPRGSGKTTLILNIISNFYKAYFHNIIVFSPTMAGDAKWEVVKKMKGLVSQNKHLKELEESGSGKRGGKAPPQFGKRKAREVDEEEERRAKLRIQDAFRTSWHSLFAGTGPARETVGMMELSGKGDCEEKKKKEQSEFTGRIPAENFYTSYDEDTLQGIMTQAMEKIDRFRAKGFTKHHSDRTLLVFDDLVGSTLFTGKKENPFKRLNTTQRHYSISTMMVSQGYKEIPKTVRTNASCLVLFEIPNESEVEVIYEENPVGYSRDQWMAFYRQCTSRPYGFMVINYMKPKGQLIEQMEHAIALCGPRYSGKDTLCMKIMEVIPDARRIAFADAVKRDFASMHGLDADALISSRTLKEFHRPALIEFAEAWRKKDPEHWVKRALDGVKARVGIVSDCRFPEEIAALRKRCGKVVTVRLGVSDEERKRRGWVYDPAVDEHESETQMRGYECDYTLTSADKYLQKTLCLHQSTV